MFDEWCDLDLFGFWPSNTIQLHIFEIGKLFFCFGFECGYDFSALRELLRVEAKFTAQQFNNCFVYTFFVTFKTLLLLVRHLKSKI